MLLGMLPLSLLNSSAASTSIFEGDVSNDIKDFVSMNMTEPDGFDDTAVTNPYGLEKGQEMFLSEEHELFMYYSWGGGSTIYQGVADTYNGSANGLVFDDNDDTGDFESVKDLEKKDSASFMQAVSFAPTSSGRKTHVAVVGYNADNKRAYTWVIDATTGKTASNIYTLCDITWMNDLAQFEAANFFAITAGKYDANDERESIVIYVAGQGTHARLYEMRYDPNASGDNRYTKVTEARGKMLNDHYPGDGRGKDNNLHDSDDDNNKRNKLAADLATGDFNGDGADDLAVVSYMLGAKNGDNYKGYAYMPYLSVLYGVPVGQGNVNKYDQILDNNPDLKEYVCNVRQRTNDKCFEGMFEAGIAAGDVDGDGYDEIVVAGIRANVYSQGKDSEWSNDKGMHKDDIDDEKLKVAVIDANNGYNRKIFTTSYDNALPTNEWTRHGFWDHVDEVASQVQIECVAINGQNAAEYVFISGTLYEVKGSNISAVTTPNYFTTADSGCGRFATSNVYIDSIVAGNFDGNDLGREQLAFTVALKEGVSVSKQYTFYTVILGGKDYKLAGGAAENTDKGQYGTASAYYMSDPESNASWYVTDQRTEVGDRTNCFVVDVDIDQDGTVAKYAGHGYIYSDPQVLAVLQAAPYFGELGGNVGETIYGFSQTYTTGTKTGSESSWSAGILAEATVGPVRMSVEHKYQGAMIKSFENSISTSYGSQFTALANDSVVLSRTPFDVYTYDIWSQDGTNGDWTENGMSFQIPREPTYIQLSVKDYNVLVDYYNSCLDASGKNLDQYKLKKLNDQYLGQEGNPWGYRNDANGWKGFTSLSNATYAFGHNGTSTANEYTEEQSKTESKEQTHGYSYGLSVAVGGDVPGGGGWVGASGGFDVSSLSGVYKSTTDTKKTTGMVFDIDSAELAEDTGLDEAIFKAYGFDWIFGKWSHNLGAAGNTVPVYGYLLSNIKAPQPIISSLKAQLVATTTTRLSWNKPEDSELTKRNKIVGYNIYRVMDEGTDILVNTSGLIPADATSYEFSQMLPATKYTFVIKCVLETPSGNVDGEASNQVSVITSGSLEELVTPHIGDNGNWWIGENDTGVKAEGTDGVAPHIGNNGNWFIGNKDTGVKAAGVDGRGIISIEITNTEGLVDTYTITYTDYTTSTFTVTNGEQGIQGIQGQKGEDGHTPVITIDSDGNWCVDGVSTGIKAQGDKGDKGDIGANGINGKDGKDGKDGLTPSIGENGNWWIGETDTGVKAAIKGDGTEDVDGDGIISAKTNEKGELVLTLADGSTFRAVNADVSVQAKAGVSDTDNGDMNTVKMLATIALILSALSLLWNAAALVSSLIKKKKS